MELEPVFDLADLDLVFEAVRADAFSAGGALAGIAYYCSHSSLLLYIMMMMNKHFIFTFGTSRSQVLDIKDSHWARGFQVFGILAGDLFFKFDLGHQPIIRSGNRRPFSVGLSDSFLTEKLHLDFLARSHLGDEDIIKQRLYLHLLLSRHRYPLHLPRQDVRVHVELLLVHGVVHDHGRVLVSFRAGHMQLQLYAVSACVPVVTAGIILLLLFRSLLVLYIGGLMVLKQSRIGLNGDEADSVCEVLVRDDGRVLPHIYFLNRHCWNLRNKDPPKRVRQRWLHPDQVEHDVLFVQGDDVDVAVVNETLQTRLSKLVGARGETGWVFERACLLINNNYISCK